MTSRTDGEYRKLNTLTHYKVSDGAQMALIPKQMSNYNLSLGSNASANSYHRLGMSISFTGIYFSFPSTNCLQIFGVKTNCCISVTLY